MGGVLFVAGFLVIRAPILLGIQGPLKGLQGFLQELYGSFQKLAVRLVVGVVITRALFFYGSILSTPDFWK